MRRLRMSPHSSFELSRVLSRTSFTPDPTHSILPQQLGDTVHRVARWLWPQPIYRNVAIEKIQWLSKISGHKVVVKESKMLNCGC
jgi:hypothetical protein